MMTLKAKTMLKVKCLNLSSLRIVINMNFGKYQFKMSNRSILKIVLSFLQKYIPKCNLFQNLILRLFPTGLVSLLVIDSTLLVVKRVISWPNLAPLSLNAHEGSRYMLL